MSKVISISNHKGGVGKTTSAINIGAGLNILGKKVLLVDLDPQANLSQSLGLNDQERTIYGAIRGEYKLEPVEIVKGLDVLPSTLDLSGAEIELSGEAGREYIKIQFQKLVGNLQSWKNPTRISPTFRTASLKHRFITFGLLQKRLIILVILEILKFASREGKKFLKFKQCDTPE